MGLHRGGAQPAAGQDQRLAPGGTVREPLCRLPRRQPDGQPGQIDILGVSFGGRLMVVTGGARGQGALQARHLAARGAQVIVADILEDEGRALADEIGAQFARLDVTSEADWAALQAQCGDWPLHGLVNNAGLYRPETIPDTTPEDFDLHYKVNQFGTYLGVKFAEAAMGPDGGSIVNISSLAGLRASKGIAYVGTKWAVRGMTKTAARELGPRGIRVNSVHPGIILTPMLDAWSDEDLKTRTAQVPLGRAGMPEDVVHMVLFLLSDFSLYISGGEIAIDGGLSV